MKMHPAKFSILLLSMISCSSNAVVNIQGAGSSFASPVFTRLFADYAITHKTHVSYQATGSGAGIQNIASGIVDFGATDAFLSDQDLKNYQEQAIDMLHIPAVLSAVNFTYNIPAPGFSSQDEPIYLNPELIYQIYSGQITKWNDPQIVSLNQELSTNKERVFPDVNIIPVFRSDSSGTTFTVSEFMTKANKKWADTFGTGKSLNWITGIGQKGNSGIMAFTKENTGSISYVDYVYAKQNNFPVAAVQNKAGNYMIGDIQNAAAAAHSVTFPADSRISLTYRDSTNAAPMTTFTYILVRKEQHYNNRSKEQAQALVDLLAWMFTDKAQAQHENLYFSPLPQNVIDTGKNILTQIKYNGETLYSPE